MRLVEEMSLILFIFFPVALRIVFFFFFQLIATDMRKPLELRLVSIFPRVDAVKWIDV